MNAAHLNLYQVCRLCLCELNGSSFVPIFDNKDSNLSHKIKSCFSISIDESDRLPNVLCPACTRDVERFYKFKEKVLKNNAFLRTYVSQRERKATQFVYRKEDGRGVGVQPVSPVKPPKGGRSAVTAASGKSVGAGKRMPAKSGGRADAYTVTAAGVVEASECLSSLGGYSCELSNTLFDNSNKVKVEIMPQVDNDVYSSAGYGHLKGNVVEMWTSSPTDDAAAASSSSAVGFRPLRSEDAVAVANLESAEGKSTGVDYAGVIRHSSDDFGASNSSFDKYISVHVKEEVCKDEYDSEDTKSAASLTFREEDEDKLVIDEETMEVKQIVNLRGGDDSKPSDSCILLRTLISTSNPNQIVQVDDQLAKVVKKKASTFSPQILVNDMSGYSSSHGPDYSPRAGGTPNSEKSSTRRKQKCPTKSANEIIADAGDETDDESRAELAPLSEHPQPIMYHQEIVNISPVTVTCSSNGGEEIVGYNQSQFLDEVLSRHSSPASSPPMVGSSQAERLHKACDVLLRAASKIQDLPPGIQQEEVVVEEEGESITLYTNADPLGDIPNEQITIRHNPVPLYEINFSSVNAINDPNRSTKKIKSRDKLQNMPQHKECNNCHAVQTTIWRRDRFGNIVCNACGLYYKLHNYDRPCRMRRDEIHKRNRKRNLNENKAKKAKRNSGGAGELDSSREQENSSGSFTPPSSYGDNANHVSIPDLYHPYNLAAAAVTVGMPGGVVVASGSAVKKRRRSPGPASLSGVASQFMHEEMDGDYAPQLHETQAAIEQIEEISVNGSELSADGVSNHGYGQSTDKVAAAMSAFQLSTHFVPINGKAYEEEEEEEEDDDEEEEVGEFATNENSMGETPLNLATDSH